LRVPRSARWMDASAVRLACNDVTPKVAPSTATTSSVEPRKIFPASPKPLVALESGIRWIVLAVLVLVGLPLVAAGVEGDLEVDRPPPPPPPPPARACLHRSARDPPPPAVPP